MTKDTDSTDATDATVSTDTAQAGNGDGPAVYNGTDDSVLPVGVQFILANLPEEQANEMRAQLVGNTVADLEAQFPTVSAAEEDLFGAPFQGPETVDTAELWKAAMDEIEHIAKMFKTLADAGMPPEMAMDVIGQRVPTVTAAPPAQIQTAGPRIAGVTTPAGVHLGGHFGATVVPSPFGNGAR